MYGMSVNRRFLSGGMAVLFLVACGGGADEGGAPTTGGDEATEGPAIDPATAGAVVGVVSFDGSAPAPEQVDMSEEPDCLDKHGGSYAKPVAVVSDGRLGDVFVYVKEGVNQQFPAPSEAKTLDQDGCVYKPHVLGIQTGQTLEIKNSDGLLHNVNASPSANRGFNISQPTDMTSTRDFSQREVMIPVRCDVHGWMEAYIGVLDHPYYAVTGEDGGFRIENLPAGDYVIEAWHEEYGTQTQNVTVAAQEEVQADFSYSASMAATAVVPLGEPLVLHPRDHSGHAGAGSR